MAVPKASPETLRPPARGPGLPLGRLYLGFVLIGAGVLFLASNAGWMPFHCELRSRILWPLLVILIGLSMVTLRGWAGGLVGVPLIVVLAVVTLFGILRLDRSDAPSLQRVKIEKISGASSARVKVTMGMGRLEISGGATALVDGSLVSWMLGVEQDSCLQGGVQRVDLEVNPQFPNPVSGGENDFRLALTDRLPVALSVASGASHVKLDLESVEVTSLDLEVGLSAVEVRLGAKTKACAVMIEGGASSLDLVVPEDAGVRLVSGGALISEAILGLKKVSPHGYESEGFEKAPRTITIEVETGLSRLSLRRRGSSSRTST